MPEPADGALAEPTDLLHDGYSDQNLWTDRRLMAGLWRLVSTQTPSSPWVKYTNSLATEKISGWPKSGQVKTGPT